MLPQTVIHLAKFSRSLSYVRGWAIGLFKLKAKNITRMWKCFYIYSIGRDECQKHCCQDIVDEIERIAKIGIEDLRVSHVWISMVRDHRSEHVNTHFKFNFARSTLPIYDFEWLWSINWSTVNQRTDQIEIIRGIISFVKGRVFVISEPLNKL